MAQNSENISIDDKILELGPLESVFPCSTSKILDFMITFKEFDYSISDISKKSNVSFKTALNEIRKLENQKIILKTRDVGRAMMYKLNPESTQSKYLENLAFDVADKRAMEMIKNIS